MPQRWGSEDQRAPFLVPRPAPLCECHPVVRVTTGVVAAPFGSISWWSMKITFVH